MSLGELGGYALRIVRGTWRLLRKVAKGLAHPVFGAIEATLAIVTGLVGAIYTVELKSWLTSAIQWWRNEQGGRLAPQDPGVSLFWKGVAITGILHVVRAVARQIEQEHVQEKFERAASVIQDIVSTNASRDYLNALSLTFENCSIICNLAVDSNTQRAALQQVLSGIAALASTFDNKQTAAANPAFVANVMWYIPSDHAETWDSVVAFRATGTTMTGVRGVLAMPSAFCVAANPADDHGMSDFALDVPEQCGSAESGWSILPGAPFSFMTKDLEHYHPAQNITTWMKLHGDFAPSVVDKVGVYFRANKGIQGFMCLPLFVPTAGFVEFRKREVLGILNIHWSRADLLHHADTARKFGHTIYPLRVLLCDLMVKIKNADGWPARAAAPARTP